MPIWTWATPTKHRAAWVVLPNTYFDPKKGHELYNRYLDELELAAELGFDGISVNEHHQNAYGLMPSPVVMAAALARRTKHAKIAILGNAFCLREHPLTLAEEHAMLDCITGGRLDHRHGARHRRRILLDGRQSGILPRALSGGA
jgi:alkanesulfonate monooxygenase SsuD/methylene tetrahydromethanopterin reductase-like flavin-dependent oxidoreductase (luciferase family)